MNSGTVSRDTGRRTCSWLLCSVVWCVLGGLALVPVVLAGAVTWQSQGSDRLVSRGADPKPEDATRAILAAFDTYRVVGMLAGHGLKDVDDFVLSLIRHPAFPNTVNDIVVECSNSLHQTTLDRYIAGEDLPLAEVRQVWRNTQPGCVSAFHEGLFPLVRRVNQRLAPAKRLRVLAGEPPVDWNSVKSEAEVQDFLGSGIRDRSMAAIMEKDVLARHRKALLLYGTGHLWHGFEYGGVNRYEKNYPGVTLVIDVHGTGTCDRPVPTIPTSYHDIETRMAAWPVPSLARVKDTWLTALDETYSGPLRAWSKSVDALLYLGPTDLLLSEPSPAHVWLDAAYMAELQRRASIPGAASQRARDRLDPAKVREREANPLFCTAGTRSR